MSLENRAKEFVSSEQEINRITGIVPKTSDLLAQFASQEIASAIAEERERVMEILTYDSLRPRIGEDEVSNFALSRALTAMRKIIRAGKE